MTIEAPAWAGARVFVDGKYKGILPDAARQNLPGGTHSITLSREGMNPVTEKVSVTDAEPRSWSPPAPSPAAPGATP